MDDIGQIKSEIVASRLSSMNPLNKGIVSVPDISKIDLSHFAVCVYGATTFIDIDNELINRLDKGKMK